MANKKLVGASEMGMKFSEDLCIKESIVTSVRCETRGTK